MDRCDLAEQDKDLQQIRKKGDQMVMETNNCQNTRIVNTGKYSTL